MIGQWWIYLKMSISATSQILSKKHIFITNCKLGISFYTSLTAIILLIFLMSVFLITCQIFSELLSTRFTLVYHHSTAWQILSKKHIFITNCKVDISYYTSLTAILLLILSMSVFVKYFQNCFQHVSHQRITIQRHEIVVLVLMCH